MVASKAMVLRSAHRGGQGLIAGEKLAGLCRGKVIVMLEKEPLENGTMRITFRVSHYIWADSIALVGEFNDWDAHGHHLRQTRDDGEWHISLVLPANRTYRFRYLVDGKEWMDDDHADSYAPNPFGGFDSVVFT